MKVQILKHQILNQYLTSKPRETGDPKGCWIESALGWIDPV